MKFGCRKNLNGVQITTVLTFSLGLHPTVKYTGLLGKPKKFENPSHLNTLLKRVWADVRPKHIRGGSEPKSAQSTR